MCSIDLSDIDCNPIMHIIPCNPNVSSPQFPTFFGYTCFFHPPALYWPGFICLHNGIVYSGAEFISPSRDLYLSVPDKSSPVLPHRNLSPDLIECKLQFIWFRHMGHSSIITSNTFCVTPYLWEAILSAPSLKSLNECGMFHWL